MSHSLFHPQSFAGRVYGITGAAHGIGEAATRLLSSLGATVLAIDRDQSNLQRLSRDLSSSTPPTAPPIFLHADISNDALIAQAITDLATHHGRIDGWVNNAMYARRGTLESQPPQEMNAAWNINVLVPWKISRLLLPHFKQAGGGSIVNISSVHAHQTTPASAAYVATKAALEGLTRALAIELAPQRIRVNAIIPGYILTYAGTEVEGSAPSEPLRDDTTPPQKSLQETLLRQIEEIEGRAHQPWPTNGLPGDVAHLIAFLLSDASSFITGASIPIDGGLSIDVRAANEKLATAHQEMEQIRQQLQSLGLPPGVTY